ncbi:MAG: hypothetical protein ACTSR9_18825 [Candidatus Thorarchaeota archaeon]
MDFLVLSDIHHCWVHLEKMISIAGDFDGVIFLGDLLIHDSERVVVSEDIRYFSRIYDVAKYMVGVPGNGAIPEIVEYLDDIGVSVHGKSRILADIGFFVLVALRIPRLSLLNSGHTSRMTFDQPSSCNLAL